MRTSIAFTAGLAMHGATAYPSIAALDGRIGSAIKRHFDLALRDLLSHGPEVVRDPRFVRLLTGAPHPYGNMAALADGADERAAQEAIGPLCQSVAPSAVILSGRDEEALGAFLRSRGFQPHDPMPAMAVEIDRLGATSLPAGYTFVRLGGDPAAREAWTRTFTEGFEIPPEAGKAFAAKRVSDGADSPVQFFAVEKGGRFVATSALCLEEGLAGIYCVSTIPAERGKGLGAHATAEPLRRAYALGYRVGILQASAAGHPVYLRLGFADYGHIPLYARMPA